MPREPLSRLLARLAAAGVAEPSTLVIECAGEPAPGNLPRTAMSSRVHVPTLEGAAFHPTGLAEGYCTYAIEWDAPPDQPREIVEHLSSLERLALGLRLAVERSRTQDVPVRRFVLTGFTDASGSIDHAWAQAFADVFDARISVRACRDVDARGQEILRRLEVDRGCYSSVSQAIKTLADVTLIEKRVWRRLDRVREIAQLLGE